MPVDADRPFFAPAVTSVLILALGIGMATAMFTVFRAVLVEPLPVSNPGRLVVLRSLNRGRTHVDPAGTVIIDMQRGARAVSDIAGVYHLGSIPLPFEDGERRLVINRSAACALFCRPSARSPAICQPDARRR